MLPLLIISCEDFLDIEDENAVTSEAVLQTEEGVISALNGVYASLQDQGLYGAHIEVIGDAAADNTVFPSDREGSGSNFDRLPHAYNLELDDVNTASFTWEDAYVVINNINSILTSVEGIPIAEGLKDRVIGECLALRALMHFELVKIFSQDYNTAISDPDNLLGVPYITIVDATAQPSRNTMTEVFDNIFNDINTAIPLIQNNDAPDGRSGSNEQFFLNYYGALGIRAKVNFYITDYSEAIKDVNIIINGPYSLSSYEISSITLDGSGLPELDLIQTWSQREIIPEESIFMLDISSDDGVFANRSLIDIYTNYGGNAAHGISDDLYNLYEATDIRRNWYQVEPPSVSGSGVDLHVFKYPGTFGFDEDDHSFPIMRLSEFILMKAEIEARNGNEEVARNFVNQITTRANASVITSTGNQLIEDIITERRKEMAFEGNRLFDLKRLQRSVTRTDCTLPSNCTVNAKDRLFAWPIPQDEFNGNPNMKQNPGF
ncbi:RagB/SusD family nutrient uptake outer membrane protein [Aquimarina gracilis]